MRSQARNDSQSQKSRDALRDSISVSRWQLIAITRKREIKREKREGTRNNINLKLGRWNFARRHLIFSKSHRARKRRCTSQVKVSTSPGIPLTSSPARVEGARLDSDPYFKVLLPGAPLRRDLSNPSRLHELLRLGSAPLDHLKVQFVNFFDGAT